MEGGLGEEEKEEEEESWEVSKQASGEQQLDRYSEMAIQESDGRRMRLSE